MAQGPVSATAASGLPMAEQLDDEEIAIFVPVADLKSLTGSYRHMRVAARVICTAQLRRPLPPTWSKVRKSDLKPCFLWLPIQIWMLELPMRLAAATEASMMRAFH